MNMKHCSRIKLITPALMLVCSLLGLTASQAAEGATNRPPIRVAMYGLVHGHARGFVPRVVNNPDVQLVGIIEPDQKVAAIYAKQFKLSTNLFYPSLEALLAKTNVQAVATFTCTYDHQRVVEECAAHGIDVMMEKPLAVNMQQAQAMAVAAKKGGIQLIVNYETTWYSANHAAYDLVCNEKGLGDIRKVVVHDGHQGPKEIGCQPEFLAWLTDPVLNGGGALPDFGCYGADLMTWLMQGQRPTSVFAVTQHIKPDVYPKVEDEATIVLSYPKAQGIIQASWNWPYNRKDMEIYCQGGYVLVPRNDTLRVLKGAQVENEKTTVAMPLAGAEADSVSYLAAVVRGEIKPAGLSSLAVNMIVTEILDAARESAATGKRIDLPATPAWSE
ncbi:MAG TPA: Gfo/Idh/MocA family oxidoreductase [Candidatus Acidoferrales bacterium]|nr:Gfo/Idh/MocA family oxidoreductase [Candidatus Acidoferrales bacterium]